MTVLPFTPLTGRKLLAAIRDLDQDATTFELLLACGYVQEDGSNPRAKDLYEALLTAKGEEIGLESSEPTVPLEPPHAVAQRLAEMRYRDNITVMAREFAHNYATMLNDLFQYGVVRIEAYVEVAAECKAAALLMKDNTEAKELAMVEVHQVMTAVEHWLTKEQLDRYNDVIMALLAVLSLDQLAVLKAPLAIGDIILNPKSQ